jgi:hypothetical protein
MTLPLPANESEAYPLDELEGWIPVHDPRVHRVQPQFLKSITHDRGGGTGAVPSNPKGLISDEPPEPCRFEMPVYFGQPNHPDRYIVVIAGEHPNHLGGPLGHDLEPRRAQYLLAVTEVQPLVILLLGCPAGDEIEQVRAIDGFELHGAETPLSASADRS